MCFLISSGDKPNVLQGTRSVRPINLNQRGFPKIRTQWGVILSQNNGDNIVLHIRIPPQVQVGIWNIEVICNIAGQREPRTEFKVSNILSVKLNYSRIENLPHN